MSDAQGLGLESGTVRVVPYDPRWATAFERASGELSARFGSRLLGIHHVGSTAVPGLCAKPILDILVSIADFERGLDLVPGLTELGYEFRPGEEIPDRHYFRRRTGTIRTQHLSLAEPGSKHHVRTLAFRDALLRDPDVAVAYGELKLRLARRFPHDRRAYTDGKAGFIARVVRRHVEGLEGDGA